MSVRLAIDIGGTFTDATLIDEETGEVSIAKVLTTPSDPSEGFMQAAERALAAGSVDAGEVTFVVHATTVATNAIIEGKIARSGFVTTEGFRDLLEIARQVRPTLYDTQFEKAAPLVPRDRAVAVAERLGPKGEVLRPLEDDSVRDAAAILRREGVESVAVCLLHAYVNDVHEQRVGEILAEELPGIPVSLSSDVAPEFREYLRASTTVINAVIRPVVERYLQRIESRLADAGVEAKLLVMQSSGGIFGSDAAAVRPVFMVESGPAAGVIASAYLGETLGRPDILSFDMGGTTAKVGLIQDGRPSVTKDYNVGGHAGAGIGGMSLSGYPVRTPVVDLVEIGAGGGSIAWVDSGGLLRVGPRSAGADPGPVCYRRGGVEPTVTDANVVLGRLNPTYFLGGEIGLDVEGAARAIEERCAKPLGLSVTEAANGIVEIANAAMVNALHLISVQRGYDPRDFVLVGFGGAGPVHANALARDAEMPTLLIPRSPGIFSATGLLTTDLKRDTATTIMRRLDELDHDEVATTFASLEATGRAELEREGLAADAIEFLRQIDLRYVGQSYELTIPAGDGLLERFHAEHDRTYGFNAPAEPIEVVSLRLTSIGRIAKPPPRRLEGGTPPEPKERRPVYFAEAGDYVDCPIHDRYGLPAGTSFAGPAVVEEFDSTTVVHPGFSRPGRRGRQPGHREGGLVSESHGIVLAKDVMVPMRDGVRLAFDIYRPALDGNVVAGRFPTIMLHTPYDKTDKRYSEIADFFVPKGYNVVLIDLRDRYRSEASGVYFHAATPHTGRDGYDICEWIAAQEWSNGRIGTVGSSYAAITQVRTALERPPHLTAIWPDVVPTNSFQNQSREGGAMQQHMFWALFIHAQDANEIAAEPEKQQDVWNDLRDLRQLFRATPWKRGQTSLRHVPTLEDSLLDYYTRGAYDEYWDRIEHNYTKFWDQHADIPATMSTGWYDPFPGADTEYFAAMAVKNEAPQRLVVGPWSHVGMRGDATYCHDVDFGYESTWGVNRYFDEQLAFFDRWLPDDAPGQPAGEAPVRIFVMGGGHRPQDGGGQARPRWTLARRVGVAARPCGRDALFPPHRRLALDDEPAVDAPPRRFTFDPAHPVPTIGGLYCSIGELPAEGAGMEPAWARFLSPVLRLRDLLTPGPADQKETPAYFGSEEPYPRLSERPDVLVFQTDPLGEPLEVTGPMQVHLWVASSALDTDFTAKLVDVHPRNDDYPEGYDMLLNDSVIRCRYREGFDREVMLEPGVPVPVTITLPPTSNLFDVGHRIRVDVSSSNWPRLDVNPNTGEPIGRHTHQLVAEQTVHADAERPSHIVLPVIPR